MTKHSVLILFIMLITWGMSYPMQQNPGVPKTLAEETIERLRNQAARDWKRESKKRQEANTKKREELERVTGAREALAKVVAKHDRSLVLSEAEKVEHICAEAAKVVEEERAEREGECGREEKRREKAVRGVIDRRYDSDFWDSPLYFAAKFKRGRDIERLLDAGEDPLDPKYGDYLNPLIRAIETRDCAWIKIFFEILFRKTSPEVYKTLITREFYKMRLRKSQAILDLFQVSQKNMPIELNEDYEAIVRLLTPA